MSNKILIILQARSSSKRLPGKSLSSFKNIPLAVLCAKRLSNKGRKLIVATSKHRSDDYLCHILDRYKIKYFRGSLQNVFSRFVKITKKFNKNGLVISATADNPFPDGNLVEILIDEIKKRKIDYLRINNKIHNLPYGITLEIFTAKKLFETNKKRLNKQELEHVTLNMYKNKKILTSPLIKRIFYKKNLSKKRVTIDNLQDYKNIYPIFEKLHRPFKCNWKELLKKI